MLAILVSFAGLILGASLGRRLAKRGITSTNALEGKQGVTYAVLLFGAVVASLFYFKPVSEKMPAAMVMYGEAVFIPGTQFLACFGLGFLVFLEWPGRRDRMRRRNLILGSVLLAFCVGFLFYRSIPIDGMLGDDDAIDGVVMQTTPYSCAAASIATLVRQVLGDTTTTERTVVALTRTDRWGTSTLREIKVMRRLGLEPHYEHGLAVDDLIGFDAPALLHVNEPVSTGATIKHTVALLSVDAVAGKIVVGNPLRGRQEIPFAGLDGYWLGEAVIVGVSRR